LEIGGSTYEDDTKRAIKCPWCKRDCKFIWQTFEDGSEHIRQECPVHGYIRFAPQTEPYKTIADQTVENDDQKTLSELDYGSDVELKRRVP
jgi:hypothetical protein